MPSVSTENVSKTLIAASRQLIDQTNSNSDDNHTLKSVLVLGYSTEASYERKRHEIASALADHGLKIVEIAIGDVVPKSNIKARRVNTESDLADPMAYVKEAVETADYVVVVDSFKNGGQWLWSLAASDTGKFHVLHPLTKDPIARTRKPSPIQELNMFSNRDPFRSYDMKKCNVRTLAVNNVFTTQVLRSGKIRGARDFELFN